MHGWLGIGVFMSQELLIKKVKVREANIQI